MRCVAVLLLAACGTSSPAPMGGDDDPGMPPIDPTDPTDNDADGIPEQLEDSLMAQFGPELHLPPDSEDWTRPANVDWYLPQVAMRFDHSGCPDCGVIDLGKVAFDNIATQTHYTKSTLCQHTDDPRASNKKHLEFFLQPTDDDAVHPGIPVERKSEWRVYTQVRKSSYVRGDGKAAAYDLQVWTFFPYNDFIGPANHEGDWEHVTISIAEDLTFVSAFYATHHTGIRVDDPTAIAWSGTHPIGYVADGSHATYPTVGAQSTGVPGADDHTYDNGPVWNTWENFKNLGAVDHILNDQTWAQYGGRWGEVGELDDTSGPVGPMFNGKWDTTTEY
jgi:hypothetical protein